MHELAPPPLTRLERMVLEADFDVDQGSIDEQCNRVRAEAVRFVELLGDSAEELAARAAFVSRLPVPGPDRRDGRTAR